MSQRALNLSRCAHAVRPLYSTQSRVQEAYYEVMSYMWGLKDSSEIPTLPPSDVIAEFNRRFDTTNPSNPHTTTPPGLSLPQQAFVTSVQELRSQRVTSRTSNNLLRLEDRVKEYMMESCQRHGLSAWRPDFRTSPSTPYNNTHRMVAEEVFEELATAHAFSHKRVSLAHLKNKRFLRKAHNNYVYHVQRVKWKQELLKPGSVALNKKKQAVFQRRKRVSILARALQPLLITHS